MIILLLILDIILFTIGVYTFIIGVYSDNYFAAHGYYPDLKLNIDYFKWSSLTLFLSMALLCHLLQLK